MRILIAAVLITLPLAAQGSAVPPAKAMTKVEAAPFDPTRDSAKDLEAAKVEAKKTNRRILLDVGGNWCSWCRLMDRWFKEHPAVREARDKAFVVVPVNYSPENKNEAFLGQYPKVDGYPHLFVLDADGKLIQDQSTGALEDGHGYSEAAMNAFIAAWGPSASANVKTVAAYLEAFRRMDREAILAGLSDKVVWRVPGAFAVQGKADFAKHLLEDGFTGKPGIRVDRMVEMGETVLVEGQVLAPKADGSVLTLAFCDVFDLKDAKIHKLTSYLAPEKS